MKREEQKRNGKAMKLEGRIGREREGMERRKEYKGKE